MAKEKTLNWSNITFRQFRDLQSALEVEDETEKAIAITQAIYGKDVIELSLPEFNKLCKNLAFLSTEIPNNITVKEVKVNGREYYFDGLLGKISTAQYIDFQNYLKMDDEAKTFSVFMIPKGHKYNDGYDMEQVFEDILDMPITVLNSASFFFTRQFNLFIRIFQRYSMKNLKKLKLPKKLKQNLETILTNSNSLISSLMSQNFAK